MNEKYKMRKQMRFEVLEVIAVKLVVGGSREIKL